MESAKEKLQKVGVQNYCAALQNLVLFIMLKLFRSKVDFRVRLILC